MIGINKIPIVRPKTNTFDFSHTRQLTANFGFLYPILSEEVLPGDTWRMNKTEILTKLMPLGVPAMARIHVYTHAFFVPYRLVWDNWEDFITGGEDGTDSSVMPYVDLNALSTDYYTNGSLLDHLGGFTEDSPGTMAAAKYFNALPFRSYQLIWNEFFRDQNLQDEVDFAKTDGNGGNTDDGKLLSRRYRNWLKDYFVGSLPWTQRGSEVELPISGTVDINLVSNLSSEQQNIVDNSGAAISTQTPRAYNDSSDSYLAKAANSDPIFLDPNGTLEGDLSTASSTTINDLRSAIKLQEWLEKMARGGAKYHDQMISMFGVESGDYRLQRPEFLGSSKQSIVISEVLQTSQSDTTPQGTQAGQGIGVGAGGSFKYYAREHGQIMVLLSVLPVVGYGQGTRRHLLKTDKTEFFWKEFATLGEQEVYEPEIYDDSVRTFDMTGKTFGYNPRYQEYRFIPHTCHGEMKVDGTFENWNLNRQFSSTPSLNEAFIKANTVSHRIFADTASNDKFIINLYHDLKVKRQVPYFGIPKM